MDFDFDLPDTRTMSEQGAWMTPKGLNGLPLGRKEEPLALQLLGPDSDTYRHEMRGQVRRKVREIAAGAQPDDADAEEDRFTIELLVKMTIGWRGVFTRTGEPIPFSKEAVEALYRGFPRIMDQVDAWIANVGNFIKAP